MWDKDHPWNHIYQAEKEFVCVDGIYVAFSLNENKDGTLTAFSNLRVYKVKSFELVEKDSLRATTLSHINGLLETYAKKHKAVMTCF